MSAGRAYAARHEYASNRSAGFLTSVQFGRVSTNPYAIPQCQPVR